MSHRAVIFAAAADGVSHLRCVLDSADVRSTLDAVSALGAAVSILDVTADGLTLEVAGWGARGPLEPKAPIGCGNSGTTARLLMGLVAGWPVEVAFTGDASLSTRPMLRIAEPLRAMGARIETAEGGTLPARVKGGGLAGIEYLSPVASAQVKSAVLLAGLRARGRTSVTEPARSRDHTERMLPAFGVPVETEPESLRVSVAGPSVPSSCELCIPSDPSSAAFFVVAAAIVAGSRIHAARVSLNPTRAGFVRVLRRMGARVLEEGFESLGTEDVATLHAEHAGALRATVVGADEVPGLIDELPVLALAATQAAGTTRFEGIGELRVKESDRLEAIRAGLAEFGAAVRAGDDWLEVDGPASLQGCRVSSLGDHRMAMTWMIAGLVAEGETIVRDAEAVSVSFPSFTDRLRELGAGVEAL